MHAIIIMIVYYAEAAHRIIKAHNTLQIARVRMLLSVSQSISLLRTRHSTVEYSKQNEYKMKTT